MVQTNYVLKGMQAGRDVRYKLLDSLDSNEYTKMNFHTTSNETVSMAQVLF